MRKFLNKLTCMAVSLTFLMGCMATPAFAYSGGENGEEVKAPSVFETEEEPVTVTEQNAGPLTPEGNLAVVDDLVCTPSRGQRNKSTKKYLNLPSNNDHAFPSVSKRQGYAGDVSCCSNGYNCESFSPVQYDS